MKIARRFTRKGKNPYGELRFKPRISEICNPDGQAIFRQEDVIVPTTWSQIATDILAQKYFRKTGVPLENGTTGGEHDARQVFHRLAFTWMDWGRRYGYFDSGEDAQAFYDEIVHMLAHQMAAPNSPQWFNTGLYAVYGIQGPAQGHYYADPETGEVKKSFSAYERPQPHACQPYQAAVSTPAGPVPIGSIVEQRRVGLEVYDGTAGGRGRTRVVAVAENGVKPVFRVVLEGGAALEATGDHAVWASVERGEEGRWMRLDELAPGMRLRVSPEAKQGRAGLPPRFAALQEGRRVDGAQDGRRAGASRDGQAPAASHGGLSPAGAKSPSEARGRSGVDAEAMEGRRVEASHGGRSGVDAEAGAAQDPPGDEAASSPGERIPALPALREEAVQRIERLGPMPVFDIQTESGQYLSNGIVVHNCFILGVEDDLVNEGGILDLVTSEARLFKYGSGTGSNFSRLRARGEPLSGGGVSSGLLSFLKVADRSAAAIKSGGTTRRAAKMVTLDADHPDIEEYIRWKVQEEQKVAAMVAGNRVLRQAANRFLAAVRPQPGEEQAPALQERSDPLLNPALGRAVRQALDQGVPMPFVYKLLQLLRQGAEAIEIQELTTEWDEESYGTVSGQSSNNSVRLSTAFMQAVLEDGDWLLAGRIDPRTNRAVKARRLWDLIAYAAWSCADPGIQFHSTVNEWHTCPADGEIRASNPCSEYMFLDDTACNLASLNLLKFYDAERGRFLLEELRHAIHLWTIVLEISVLMAQFPNRRIARRSFDFRTLGLGFANLGSLLMVMGIPYDSDAGRAVAGGLAAVLTGQAYASSALLAAELGPFARFAANREPMLRVIRNHRRAAYNAPAAEYEGLSVLPRGLSAEHCPAELLAAAREAWDEALRLGEAHGYRNAQVTAIAPTGTIGLIMDCDTTGVEPDYALVKFKKLAGGGFFKIINTSIPPALRTLGYPPEQIREIVTYCVGHRTLRGAPHASREELARRGFPGQALDRLEGAVKDTFLLAPLFSTAFLGREVVTGALGIPPEEASRPGFRLLERLGYTPGQVEEAERYICGAMTLEGAPHLREEHYPVFDTANPTGKLGRRFIPWPAHIEMMAAVQPFVSGAVSKTINMPAASTIEDVKGAHLLSWQRMLKSIALYRDGSKLSQPLSSLSAADEGLARSILALAGAAGGAGWPEPAEAGVPAAGSPAGDGTAPPREGPPGRSRRRPLPSRRKGYTQKVKIAGHSLFLRTGEYPDGSLGEIFLDMYREGAAFRSLLNSFAIAVSLGLQYGVPLEEYVDAFVFSRFEPSGIVQGHDHLKVTTSVLDLIFRDLALNYLKRLDLAQVKPDDLIATNTSAPAAARRKDPNGSGAPENDRSPGGSPLPAAAAPAAPEPAPAAPVARRTSSSMPAGPPKAPADAGPGETPGEAVVPAEPVARQPGDRAAQSREGVLQASPRRISARRRDHGAHPRPERSEGGRHKRAAAEEGPEQGEAQRPAERLSPPLPEQRATARMQGYEGDPCPVCGHLTLVRNGTCLKCITCGSTTGCS